VGLADRLLQRRAAVGIVPCRTNTHDAEHSVEVVVSS
jgi:hypothetical protein